MTRVGQALWDDIKILGHLVCPFVCMSVCVYVGHWYQKLHGVPPSSCYVYLFEIGISRAQKCMALKIQPISRPNYITLTHPLWVLLILHKAACFAYQNPSDLASYQSWRDFVLFVRLHSLCSCPGRLRGHRILCIGSYFHRRDLRIGRVRNLLVKRWKLQRKCQDRLSRPGKKDGAPLIWLNMIHILVYNSNYT